MRKKLVRYVIIIFYNNKFSISVTSLDQTTVIHFTELHASGYLSGSVPKVIFCVHLLERAGTRKVGQSTIRHT